MKPITLYGETLWISPYVFSSFVALTEKRLPFEVAEVALVEGQHLAAQYRDRALTARVPSIEHEGFRMTESSAIAEYLEETFPPPAYPALLPQAPRDRARARELMAWLRSDLGALREERATVTMFYRFRLRPLGAAAAKDADKLLRIARTLIPAGGGHLFGSWSLVDAELSFMLHRLVLGGHDVGETVLDYARRQWQRPSVTAFVEHPRPAEIPESYWSISGTPQPEA